MASELLVEICPMVRHLAILLAFCAGTLPGATLERLTLDDMIEKSTDIVRARVAEPRPTVRRGVVFTEFQLTVLERWKGRETGFLGVSVPGGSTATHRQTFSGAPELIPGAEYVFFLWRGPSGIPQILGLSQGLFELKNGKGSLTAVRGAISEVLLDPRTGRAVQDSPVQMDLAELRHKVRTALRQGTTR